jgi:protein SCO1/2
MTRRAALALAALAGILAITAAWWLLALWPDDPAMPAWAERARAVCFGVAPGGLPHAGGWVLLVGEPLGMLGFLLVAWGDAVREGLGALRRSAPGRAALTGTMMLLLLGAAGALARVRDAGASSFDPRAAEGARGWARPLDAPAPPLALVDQQGRLTTLEAFRGRPVLVAFAYGHCQTVCPVIVHDAIGAVRAAREANPALLVVTLDPWRDTPARLPHLAAAWSLPAGARLLGGSVAEVERVLDDWKVARARDERTGEITHATGAYLVDRRGRLAHIASGDAARLAALLRAM